MAIKGNLENEYEKKKKKSLFQTYKWNRWRGKIKSFILYWAQKIADDKRMKHTEPSSPASLSLRLVWTALMLKVLFPDCSMLSPVRGPYRLLFWSEPSSCSVFSCPQHTFKACVCEEEGNRNQHEAAGYVHLRGIPNQLLPSTFHWQWPEKIEQGPGYTQVLTASCYLCSVIMSAIEACMLFSITRLLSHASMYIADFCFFNLKHVIAYLLSWKSAVGVGN